MNVILDSGIFIASVLPETFTPQAQQLTKQLEHDGVTFHAPILLKYELTAVSRKAVYQGRVTPQEGESTLDRLLSYAVMLHFDEVLLKRAYELATEYNRPTAYDTQYLALAERLDCEFWTTDQRLYNAVQTQLPKVQWLGSIALDDDND